jgi:hypothetical protein
MSGSNNNGEPPQPPSLETAEISPAAADKTNSGNCKHRGWTMEFDLSLLKEIRNCGAHTPGHNQSMKCWETVTTALKGHGVPFDNPRMVWC